jgi:hypothetical protein
VLAQRKESLPVTPKWRNQTGRPAGQGRDRLDGDEVKPGLHTDPLQRWR